MDSLDDWLVAIHILAAIAWVGGGLMINLLFTRVRATRDATAVGAFLKDIEFAANRAFIPASLILIVTGVWLVTRDVFELEAWVIFGIVVWVYSFVAGAGFVGPQTGRVGQAIEEGRGDEPDVQRRLGQVLLAGRIELVLFVLVVLDMSLKPGT